MTGESYPGLVGVDDEDSSKVRARQGLGAGSGTIFHVCPASSNDTHRSACFQRRCQAAQDVRLGGIEKYRSGLPGLTGPGFTRVGGTVTAGGSPARSVTPSLG